MHGLLARIAIIGPLVMAGLTVIAASPGHAQIGSTGGASLNNAAQRTVRGAEQNAKPAIAPPPVLPGTKGASEAAPAAPSAAELSPTDGLFDAINRGDLASARDAINRGANLNGQNILGLTPLELSVDLGRNDISFLLLSMRSEDASTRRTDQQNASPQAGNQARPASRPRVVRASSEPADEPAVAPRVYGGNGGTPIPAAGFLGFDSRR